MLERNPLRGALPDHLLIQGDREYSSYFTFSQIKVDMHLGSLLPVGLASEARGCLMILWKGGSL